MKFSLFLLSVVQTASAFNAPKFTRQTGTSLKAATLNGWVPNENEFAYGLPGSLEPIASFDPLGLSESLNLDQMKYYREAETTHGRVAMLALLGFLITEAPFEYHPLFNTASRDIGPAIRHLDEVRYAAPLFVEVLLVAIGATELFRALKGWESPGDSEKVLKDDYYPGDIGFDPLGLKPETFEDFKVMSTKELQNGRLAMLAVAGIVAQELVDGKEIFVHLGLSPNDFDPTTLPVQFYNLS